MKVKFVDVAAQSREVWDEVEAGLVRIHASGAYIGGAEVAGFEREFADFIGVREAVGVASGTDALTLALRASGIGPGDEVITTPLTFIATVAAIVQTGARPVFVDVEPETGALSVEAVRRYLRRGDFVTRNGPRAIVPVDLYGMPAALCEFEELARSAGLILVEDACQAHGARLKTATGWRRAGSFGHAGCFSFYPAKNLGGWGDGGLITTNDPALARKLRMLRDHGRTDHYNHAEFSINSRLDQLQALVLRAKLKRLDRWNARRRQVAADYRRQLAGIALELPPEFEDRESCYHLFVVRVSRREELRRSLAEVGIETGVHYPVPVHLQPAARHLGYRQGDFPEAERLAETVLSLPLHPHIADAEVDYVAQAVRQFV